jgi:hypothetical protein
MNIILFNLFHIGDIYFNQKFVKYLCENNLEHKFYYFCSYNRFIFNEISNLKVLVEEDELYTKYENIFIQRNMFNNGSDNFNNLCDPYFVIDNNLLFINMWCLAFNKIVNTNNNMDCDLRRLLIANKLRFNEIENDLKITLNFPVDNCELLVPTLPKVNIDEFLEWYKSNNKSLIFYYNYLPMSGQHTPVSNENEHNYILENLSRVFSDKIFIVPKMNAELKNICITNNINNIISCIDNFNCIETKSCENLVKIAKITTYCDKTFYFDVGANFLIFNSNIFDDTVKSIYINISSSSIIYNKFRSTIDISSKIYQLYSTYYLDVYSKCIDILK